ncbi:hypothetical protein K450DRAFT_258547 [Umbelopsis ramanniana AG]|uniref:Uncharacterized protein n=1 Tax=Umbelopsis ramanniana AG TaxID=1314678 RepID=A0AAD5E5Q9_UMBRA|nr:uncharacterized protein K450DRAFT_258547 [Umbelopsis ramanniana AG]KAI8576115.1 hypothetical protein K450DRAFT_258547 [Umbelopsis ramanniana AG]
MADAGRKGFGQKMEETMTPQSQKTYAQQGKEALTNGYDKVQAGITPDSQKSAHQSAYDSVKGHADDQNKSILQSAKEKMGME